MPQMKNLSCEHARTHTHAYNTRILSHTHTCIYTYVIKYVSIYIYPHTHISIIIYIYTCIYNLFD